MYNYYEEQEQHAEPGACVFTFSAGDILKMDPLDERHLCNEASVTKIFEVGATHVHPMEKAKPFYIVLPGLRPHLHFP